VVSSAAASYSENIECVMIYFSFASNALFIYGPVIKFILVSIVISRISSLVEASN